MLRKLGFLYSFLLPLGAVGLVMSGVGERMNTEEGVAYDLIAWEVLIGFICDSIYLIATNNHF